MGTAAIVAGLVLVVAAAGAMSPAFAAGKIFSFTIPGGEINDQLNRFAVLTGTQVLYDPKLLGHRFGKPLKGALSKEAAARQLLEGTGLTWRFIDDNVLVIEPAIPAQPKPVVVSRQIEEPPLSVTIVGARLLDQGAVSVKRRDPSRVESVTAQDMEKYPDTSLGDAMQRLTSVTMSRSHGEGYQITVRGFGPQFNNVLMDDNVMPSRNAGREFNFSDFSTDLISAVVVYKTAPPSFPSGGSDRPSIFVRQTLSITRAGSQPSAPAPPSRRR